jgi:predicted restriction endonuclease
MTKPRAKVNYVDNKRLYGEMIHFINSCKAAEEQDEERPRVPEYVGECIFKIATRLATKPNFASYTYRDEMISDGIEVCIRYIHNFDPNKSNNPFAYFTQIIYYAFIQRIQKEKKQAYIKAKSFENSAIMNTLVDDPTGRYYSSYHDIDSEKLAELESKVVKKNKPKPASGIESILGD